MRGCLNGYTIVTYLLIITYQVVSLSNEINETAAMMDYRILIAFVEAMAVPKICNVISKANNVALTSARLLKYDV